MAVLKPECETLLLQILSQPTAPFRETHVYRTITDILSQAQVPHFKDPIGNLVIGVGSAQDYKRAVGTKSRDPFRFFIAHTDHPGFIGTRWRSPSQLEFEWHGGSPALHLQDAQVWMADTHGTLAKGRIVEYELNPNRNRMISGCVEIEGALARGLSAKDIKATSIFGGFAFREPVWKDDSIYRTKAADDLVGCFAIVQLAIETYGKKSGKSAAKSRGGKPGWIGLLTRAEEVGFIGTLEHLELGWLRRPKRPLLCVSLETSRTLPGADIGKGPVLRLGDRFTVFDPGSIRKFTDLVEAHMPGQFQKRVMDGGSCEGTAAMVYEIPTIGISVPLGNYHNESFQGGSDSRGERGPGPEFVHENDVEGLLAMCRLIVGLGAHKAAAVKTWAADPWAPKKAEFKALRKKYRGLMRSG